MYGDGDSDGDRKQTSRHAYRDGNETIAEKERLKKEANLASKKQR